MLRWDGKGKWKMNITIRNIREEDHYAVECVTKKAFWNLNMPGCDEHYLVHQIWNTPDYVPQLSLVALKGEEIVGVILYVKAVIKTKTQEIPSLTFGPLCVLPELQRKGIGGILLKESMGLATEAGFASIFICGVPSYYPKFGFQTADQFCITMPDGSNFDAFMGIELKKGSLQGIKGAFYEPDVYNGDVHNQEYMRLVDAFDKRFPYMEKKILPGQWR